MRRRKNRVFQTCARTPIIHHSLSMIHIPVTYRKFVSVIVLATALAAAPRQGGAAPGPIVHRARVIDQTGSWDEIVTFWHWAERNGYADRILQANANRRARFEAATANTANLAAAAANASGGASPSPVRPPSPSLYKPRRPR